MLVDKEKISLRQAVFLFLTIQFTPVIRVIPVYSARYAKQAAWIAPVFSFVFLYILVVAIHHIFKSYQNASLVEVMYDVFGTFIGKVVTFLFLIWITILLGLYVRYYAIRLVGSILPDVNISVFMISMLCLVFYVTRFGKLVSLARMNEIVLPHLVIVFIVLSLLIMPNIELDKLTPVTYKDIPDIFLASFGVSGIWAYFVFIFLLGDKINDKEKIKKTGILTNIFLVTLNIILIVTTVGSFGYSVTQRTQLPFLIAVKQISLFNTLEKIESVVVAFWIASDFILISVFFYMALHIMKILFRLEDTRPVASVFVIFIYFLALYICNNSFELERFSAVIAIPLNIIFAVIPLVLLGIGKIRRKI